MNWAILATGPSMSQAVADSVRGRCKVNAVSDAYKLAPWADLLVSSDRKWWDYHKPEFSGRKLAAVEVRDVERFNGAVSGENSGLLAIRVAVSLGATRVLLCGFDMGGTHFFGPHHEPRWNTSLQRFEIFKKQFANYRPKGVEIINCTEGSALKCYPMAKLEDVLASLAEPALHAA
jgi:hypothetical protein